MRIALISCSKAKKNYCCAAKELYSASNLFNLSYQYAKATCDKIYILSSKYGLVEENEILQPYEKVLPKYFTVANKAWADEIFSKLSELEPENNTFVIFAGKDYYLNFYRRLKHYELPLEGLVLGDRMQKLNELVRTVKKDEKN